MFEGEKVRAFWEETDKKWWFNAVDICTLLTGYEHNRAREYWNHMKKNLKPTQNQLVVNYHQLKMKARDGRLRYADVLDTKQVLYLIMIIPSKEAEPYREWLAEAAENGTVADQMNALGKSNVESTMSEMKKGDKPLTRKTVTSRKIDL